MSRWQTRVAWVVVLAACVGVSLLLPTGRGQAQQARQRNRQPAKTAVESLLPQDAILYFGWEGMGAHEQAWKETAAYEALYATGLVDAVVELVTVALQEGAAQDEDAAAILENLGPLYRTVSQNGLSVAISVTGDAGPPMPQGVLVLHNAAGQIEEFATLLEWVADRADSEEREVEGRTVTVLSPPNQPNMELGWWTEGNHLVVAVGPDAVAAVVDRATGGGPNISASDLWKKYRKGKADFAVTSVGWFDFAALREVVGGMPLPPPGPGANPLTLDQVFEAVGLDGLEAVALRSGYKGEALWSEWTVQTSGERQGLLALTPNTTITLDDLPPLPQGVSSFYASAMEPSEFYETLLTVARDVAQLGPPDAAAQVEGVIENLPSIAGFDPQEEFFDTLGNVVTIYGEPHQSLFGLGVGVAVKVEDAKTLRRTLDHIWSMISTTVEPNQFEVRTTEKYGREIVTLAMANGVFNPSYVVDDEWLAIGLLPQTVEAFLLRLDGKLPSWEPSEEWQQSFAALPQEFVSISTSDPRSGVKLLAALVPMFYPGIQAALREQGVIDPEQPLPDLAELPPAELVVKPLFPNISVCTVDEEGIHCISRTSLPGLPLLGGGTDATSVGTVAVLVALLLPAVQQAREAARRTQSKNNLKQIGLALHNYHDTFNQFPQGTIPNKDLKPEKRLSWMVSILPFMEQDPLYNQIDLRKSWEAEANEEWMQVPIPSYQNPAVAQSDGTDYAPTHYVGIAGVGEDAPTLPVTSKRAGTFGYSRVVTLRDVTDGLSNTIGVTEASDEYGPWGAGGKPTIRALTEQPYVNGPDGIGSPFSGGMNALVLDGSVRFVSENIDPEVFEALSTIRGGEPIGASDY